MQRTRWGVWGTAVLVVVAVAAAQAAPEAKESPQTGRGSLAQKLGAGGDLRVQEVYFDDIPIAADPPGVARGGANHYFRVRTRVWGQLEPAENVTVYGRLCNEFWEYGKPDNRDRNAPDEVVVDQLYLEARGLLRGKADVKIGRQDLIYGTGKVILEGTPKDDSRTIYCDAAVLTWRLGEKAALDVLGIYNRPENELVLNSQDRDLTGFTPAYDDVTERGGGLYFKSQQVPELPYELYYLYKEESEWSQFAPRDAAGNLRGPVRPGQRLDAAAGCLINPELELHTFGVRLMPKWPAGIEGNFEVAYQSGERRRVDVEGLMVDGAVSCVLPSVAGRTPRVTAGLYYLSGDDPATADDEGWNPLWARYPQFSELYVYAFDAEAGARWSNLLMPHLDLAVPVTDRVGVSAMVGRLTAPEKNGPGRGDERGWLGILRTDVRIKEGLLCKKEKRQDVLAGHALLEVLEPGNYYNVDDTAIFARWEMSYTF